MLHITGIIEVSFEILSFRLCLDNLKRAKWNEMEWSEME